MLTSSKSSSLPRANKTAMSLAIVVSVLCTGCVIFPMKLKAPANDKATVMVLTNRLAGPVRRIARHAYIAARPAGESRWTIWECCSPASHKSSNPFNPSFGDEVRLHVVVRGSRAERAIECLGPATRQYGSPGYLPWPGPNSNTYVEAMMRRCEIHGDLPAQAIGKDFRGWIGVSTTSGGTGIQIETPIVGLKIGLKEGIEIHIFGLSFGIDLWPPAIIVPVGEGRIGFADR